MTDDSTKVRNDLLAGSRLLEVLGRLITVEHFCKDGTAGAGGLVVAAPHHGPRGTPLSRGHDVHTGNVASRLASALQGTSVVAHELRTFVDLNKDPSGAKQETRVKHLGRLAFREADRRLKLHYQSQLFAFTPSTVIEIHGHAHGVFDFEVSTGCQLDERVEQDKTLIAALHAFEAALVLALSESPAFGAAPPTVGMYPLNPSVRFAATGTHTFNKVEKLRELGVNIAGLHIELGKALRPDPELAESEVHYQELTRCLVLAIQAFTEISQSPTAFDFKDRLLGDFSSGRGEVATVLGGRAVNLRPIPKSLVGRRVAALCGRDMQELGLMEGHPILIGADAEFLTHIELQATTANALRAGSVGIAKKFRDELGLPSDAEVYLGRRLATKRDKLTLGYVSAIEHGESTASVGVSPFLAGELKRELTREGTAGTEGVAFALSSPTGRRHTVSIVEIDSLPHERGVALSTALANELHVTFGELICFAPAE